jgi:putative membrane protein
MNRPKHSIPRDLGNVARGMVMGGADVIPGVSGGTVALILGIYERLVTAISHFDVKLLGLLKAKQWKQAIDHSDLRFLVTLAVGIGSGVMALGVLMNRLLTDPATRPLTLAAFFGMILASAVLVGRSIEVESKRSMGGLLLLGLGGVVFANGVTMLPTSALNPSYGYLFLCGMIAICAMILPGISGAYILLILGVYGYMTGILEELAHGAITGHSVTATIVFASGCAIGLVAFSKVLRWLLAHLHAATMAVLCGFMIGALRKIWPFQTDLTPEIEKLKEKQFKNFLPMQFDGLFFSVLAIMFAAAALTFLLDWIGRKTKASLA